MSARPATLAYQLRVLARRHRALATAAVLVTVATLGAAAISVHFGLRASRSATEAKLRATAEAEARAEADAEAERARRASELAAKRFDDVRGIARALLFDVYDAIAPLAGATAPRRVVADTALEYLTALEVDAGDDAGLLAELAEGWLRLGHVLGHPSLPSLGDRVGGEAASLRALAAAEHLEHVRPDSSTGAFLAVRARLQLGLFALAGGRAEDALAFFDRALAESARLSEGGALERDVLRLEGNALHLSSNALLALGRRDQAAERLDAAVERARSLLAVDPADDVVRRDLGMALLRRANLALESAQAAVAEPALEESLACFERIGASAVDNAQARADAAIALERLGDARLALGRWDDARAALERSVAVRTELVALDPADADALRRLSVGCERLGVLFQRKGEHVAAAEAHARALEHSRALLARFPADRSAQRSVAIGLQYRGECALALGRADEAERDFLEALAVQDELAAQAPEREALDLARDRIGSLSTLGDLALTRADAQTAFERYTRLDELARSAAAVDPQHAWTRRMALVAACDLGMARRGLGEQAERDADDRGAHLAAALEEIARGEALYVELERAGFLEPGDDQALEAMRADAAACRAALESLAP